MKLRHRFVVLTLAARINRVDLPEDFLALRRRESEPIQVRGAARGQWTRSRYFGGRM
jgi:hypothetical protein